MEMVCVRPDSPFARVFFNDSTIAVDYDFAFNGQTGTNRIFQDSQKY